MPGDGHQQGLAWAWSGLHLLVIQMYRFPYIKVGFPVLIAHGVGITVWPEQMHREEAVLGARYEVIPDAKHSAQLE